MKHFKPVTPSLRGTVLVDKSELYKGKPCKSLTLGFSKTGGRNFSGKITQRHIGGGSKKKYRLIDFKRSNEEVYTIERIEYDPNRSSFISLIKNSKNNSHSYVLSTSKSKVGDKVVSSLDADIVDGNCLVLKKIPVGTLVHNIEEKPNKGGQYCRSAGTYAQLLGKDGKYAIIKLPSTEIKKFLLSCKATVGVVSNSENVNSFIGSAGRKRKMGIRPSVRGVAMNPVDHPHGGGEGRTSGGRHPTSFTGRVKSKGQKTVRTSNLNIVSKRKRR